MKIKVVTITHKPSSFLGLLVKSRSILELVIKKIPAYKRQGLERICT